jgi:hypothetical protein
VSNSVGKGAKTHRVGNCRGTSDTESDGNESDAGDRVDVGAGRVYVGPVVEASSGLSVGIGRASDATPGAGLKAVNNGRNQSTVTGRGSYAQTAVPSNIPRSR